MMEGLVKQGFTTFDGADHYGPAEDLMGLLRDRLVKEDGGADSPLPLQAYTKWCPRPVRITRAAAEEAVATSLRRMRTPALDVLQLHWWDYAKKKEMLEAVAHLDALRKEGKIRHLATTNMDTKTMETIVVGAGVPLVSNQVQFSLVDMRPARKMAPFCAAHGIHLLTYGTLMGGLLTDKYLGAPEPRTKADIPTPSLGKYFNMIRTWGGWPLFQELLRACRAVGDRHGNASIANVAVKWVLDQPAVGGVIVGLRAGLTEHAEDNLKALALTFTDEDRAQIEAVLRKGNDLMEAIGDCGDEYR
jgi:aryl-alcohol dehydrogenase-like predicted oxidoreductase